MEIKITEEMFQALGMKSWKEWGATEDNIRWRNYTIHLDRFSQFRALEFKQLIEPLATRKIKGASVALRDTNLWMDSLKDAETVKCKNAHHFFSLIKTRLLKTPGQRLFQVDTESGASWCYYIATVEYRAPYTDSHGYRHEGKTTMSASYYEFGTRKGIQWAFRDSICNGRTVAKILANSQMFTETPEQRADYLTQRERWRAMVEDVGLQCWATGTATDDLDGNPNKHDSWYWRRTNTIRLERMGERSRCVVDVFREDDKTPHEREREHVDERFWIRERARRVTEEGVAEDDEIIELESEEEEPEAIEIPIHPTVAIFDLRRHLRLRIHVSQLEVYPYDTDLGSKLVLPDDDRSLVDILLAHKSQFADIIAGKGGGAVVLCTGLPGLGKTLTAEVYAEVTQRPLYTVQCSQLGTSPDDLEDELLKCFARSERWNAILLLDEADVYVAPRGDNLEQNAIVGVFLRTLEYYKGVLFMTTNRADLVDDAIASRCIARLSYAIPSTKNQARIWRILAETSGAKLTDANIKKIVTAYPNLSGRDVKNLLKLALLIGEARGEKEVTLQTIKFVKRFKPTLDGANPMQRED